VNQLAFDTISIGSKSANPNHFIDEIRFGATQADVLPAPLPIPEPSAALAGLFALLALTHRRR
jgi:uncharacterized protein (TIGR03382 family)